MEEREGGTVCVRGGGCVREEKGYGILRTSRQLIYRFQFRIR